MSEKVKKVIEDADLNKANYYPSIESDDYYLASWGGLFARRLKEKYPDFNIEVWKAEPEFDKLYPRIAHNVECKVFPYKNKLFCCLTKEMVKELRRLKKNYNLIIYRNTLFDFKFIFIISILFPKARIVISHHGGVIPKSISIKNIFKRILLRISLTRVHTATYIRHEIKEWICKYPLHPKVVFLPVGADFNVFYPEDRYKCREELGLSQNKIYAVYVGKMFKLKGVDIILEIYNKYKDKDFEILLVGATENDELLPEVKASGDVDIGPIYWDLLRKIYSAANFYIHPAFNPNFGGIDVSLMECLACGTPVLSPMLKEYDFDTKDIGICVDSLSEFEDRFKEMLNRYNEFTNCGEIAQQYLDGKGIIIDKLYNIFMGIKYI